ncbi:MAG: O-methyltransferase [Candidatus Omnitrophota bacterium]
MAGKQSFIVSPKIERYAEDHSQPESKLFKELARYTWRHTEIPQMQVGHLEGSFLRLMVRIARARRVLEIGTFTGYSALAMAGGLPPKGSLITCDIDPEAVGIARKFWKKSPHGHKIKPVLGPALETLKKLRGPFDLIFIDADKENYIRYWEECLPKVRPGGLILVDNVLWSGRVLDPKEPSDRAIVRFNRHVRRDKRVEFVMLTLRDGLTLARKRGKG